MLKVVASNDLPESKQVATRLWDDWNTGDYGADNRSGAQKADALIQRIKRDDNRSILGHTFKAMLEAGHNGGVEVGFFWRISEYLSSGD